MPSPTTESTCMAASARQVASALVASLQQATTSARLLLLGCFQCQALKPGCWRRQDEQDGAWFDSDKLQVEHAYCYVNPVALSEATQPSTLPSPSLRPSLSHQPSITNQPLRQPSSTKAPIPLHQPRKCDGQHEAPPTKPLPVSTLPLRDSSTSSPHVTHQQLEKSLANGRTDLGRDRTPRVAPSQKEGIVIKEGARYTNSEFRSPLVESFAAKLEADLRKLEYDRQRAEGEVVREQESDREAQLDCLYRDNRRDVNIFKNSTSGIPFACVDLEDEERVENELSELEDVFECYNMTTFYSCGSTLPGTDKFSSKSRGEKYEEVFPVTFHNNNTIKVFKPTSESESPLPLTAKGESTIENVHEAGITKENDPVSEDDLNIFINTCIAAGSAEELSMPRHRNTETKNDRGGYIHFGGKSFNKLLIFNLVKCIMSDCGKQSPYPLPACGKYPGHIVQRRAIAVLLEKKDTGQLVNPSGLQVFRNSSLFSASENESYENQLLARRLVDRVVTSEVREEDRHWRNFSREEHELKEAIATELFDDLISDTASILTTLLRWKVTE